MTATLTVTPTTISRGGLAYATGRGFQPGEKVDISLAGQFLTQAQADVAGALPVTGFGVPYTTTTGTQTVAARGLTSQRVATATLTVVALSPTLTVAPTTVRPGTAVTVTACGYGGSERIVLALNGSALVTTPSAITTSATGCFNASLRLPASILAGLNTLSATGATSRVTSQVSLTGILPVAATWYFAGASTMAGETPRLSLLNPTGQSATVTVTFFSVAGTPSSAPLTVAAHARTTVD
ncbi:MAG: hypothetical protein NVSMB65_10030 [Chloroflexota bacterium]